MELQSATASGLPGPLSPTLDYALSPMSDGPSHGTSPNLSPGFSSQAAFNYNQLEGRFKQLQGKSGGGGLGLEILSKRPKKEQREDKYP